MKGFSLIELMVVLVILGILGSIVYPSYQEYILETRRNVAKACLVELTQWMERYNTTKLTFVDADPPELDCEQKIADYYSISFTATPTIDTYGFTAVAIKTQAELDILCPEITIDHLNEQGPDACW